MEKNLQILQERHAEVYALSLPTLHRGRASLYYPILDSKASMGEVLRKIHFRSPEMNSGGCSGMKLRGCGWLSMGYQH